MNQIDGRAAGRAWKANSSPTQVRRRMPRLGHVRHPRRQRRSRSAKSDHVERGADREKRRHQLRHIPAYAGRG